jgi:uncharacterized SAM-binding protein YcdF (DUF218 family)
MFFVISKIFSFLVSPLTLFFGLLVLSFLIKSNKRRKKIQISALFALYFFSNSFIFDEVARRWELPAKHDDELKSSYHYGIVLCGMASYDNHYHRINFQGSTDRLLQALDLYKRKKIQKILLTGGSGSLMEQENKEADYLKNYLLTIGIPDEDVVIEPDSRNTVENARFTAQKLGVGKDTLQVLLITSAFHMRRSLGCFKKVGISAESYVTNRFAGQRKFYFDHLFIPNTEALGGWSLFIHEWIGYSTYYLLGYL